MFDCPNEQSFYKYFKENMNSLGLYVPKNLFETYEIAVETLQTIQDAIMKSNEKTSMEDLARRNKKLQDLLVLGPIKASYYLGAVIGSLAVASGRYLGCGTSLADFLYSLDRQVGLTPEMHKHMQRYPLVFQYQNPARRSYAEIAKLA